MNMFKKTGGFTLVELIVVIAILAILAAVAVPAYSGYIGKAQEAKDQQTISAVNTAIQAATAVYDATVKADEDGNYYNATASKIEVVFEGTDAEKATADYEMYLGENSTALDRINTVKNEGGLLVGTYVAPDGE